MSPRIIMDEIHTIGQQEGGAVWEQILLLAPCPIMSAFISFTIRFIDKLLSAAFQPLLVNLKLLMGG